LLSLFLNDYGAPPHLPSFPTRRSSDLMYHISESGQISFFAGDGVDRVQNGTGASASFGFVVGMATDGLGNIYFCEYDYHVIRKITPSGVVSTVEAATDSRAMRTGRVPRHGSRDRLESLLMGLEISMSGIPKTRVCVRSRLRVWCRHWRATVCFPVSSARPLRPVWTFIPSPGRTVSRSMRMVMFSFRKL